MVGAADDLEDGANCMDCFSEFLDPLDFWIQERDLQCK